MQLRLPFVSSEGEVLAGPVVVASTKSDVIVFPQLPLPPKAPKLSNATSPYHFRLPYKLLSEVESKPPAFRKIQRNVFLCDPPAKISVDEDTCVCVGNCGFSCHNYSVRTQCNKSNCNVTAAKGDCGNRSFIRGSKVQVQTFHTLCAGWALKTRQDMHSGQFLMEYTGEVISEEQYQERMKSNKEKREINYYIMELGSDAYIDAQKAGNVSRFMNHSCGPNIQTETWNVNGERRIGNNIATIMYLRMPQSARCEVLCLT